VVTFHFEETHNSVIMTPSGTLDTTQLTPVPSSTWGGVGTADESPFIDMMGDDPNPHDINVAFGFSPGSDLSAVANPGGPFTGQDYSPTSTSTRPFTTYYGANVGLGLDDTDIVGGIWQPNGQWTYAVGATFKSIGLNRGVYPVLDGVTGEGFIIQVGRE